MNTFEKQAPMCTCDVQCDEIKILTRKKKDSENRTLGVGGRPLLVAFGGEVARFCELVRSLSSRFPIQRGIEPHISCIHTYHPIENCPAQRLKTYLRLGGAVGEACPFP